MTMTLSSLAPAGHTWIPDAPLYLFEPLRRILMPDKVVFYLDGLTAEGLDLTGLQLCFSLDDAGTTLVYEGVDDPVYFSQFDTERCILLASRVLLEGSQDCLGVYIQGQLSGPPRARLLIGECLSRLYPEVLANDVATA